MRYVKPQPPEKKSNLSGDIIAYIAKRKSPDFVRPPKTDDNSEKRFYQSSPNKNSNLKFDNNAGVKKSFEYQILFGELENMLLSMNRNDATVQMSLIKLNEIRTRILPELEKTEMHTQTFRV